MQDAKLKLAYLKTAFLLAITMAKRVGELPISSSFMCWWPETCGSTWGYSSKSYHIVLLNNWLTLQCSIRGKLAKWQCVHQISLHGEQRAGTSMIYSLAGCVAPSWHATLHGASPPGHYLMAFCSSTVATWVLVLKFSRLYMVNTTPLSGMSEQSSTDICSSQC